jgi:hypothetical protein
MLVGIPALRLWCRSWSERLISATCMPFLILGAQHVPGLLLDFVEADKNLFRSHRRHRDRPSLLVLQSTAKRL